MLPTPGVELADGGKPCSVVIVLNAHGVAEAFGPYGEEEIYEVAEFVSRLVPTWVAHLHEADHDGVGALQRLGADGVHADEPRRLSPHPTRPGERLQDAS